MLHYSLLLEEAIDGLDIKEDGIYIDATLGYAGHSREILKRMKRGFLFAFDQDKQAIEYSQKELASVGHNFKIIHSNFECLKEKLAEENVTSVDGIIFDLGLSSPQIDETSRGFSFMSDAFLDMRMNKDSKITAYVIVNTYSLEQLVEIFFSYGEEKMSKVIAKKIVQCREEREIKTTLELVEVIAAAVGAKYFNTKHPERQIFQAIRIAVNNELGVLEKVLPDALELLRPGGRISVITFHSLEDRIVKKIFKKNSDIDEMVKGLAVIPDEFKPKIKLVNRKPILPSEKEIKENSRSKSAKLRVIERT